jgi:4-phospho-D-threonate 3-dehydrogenase / 4-phospho-D-erythronate 3-dehydrogenase
LERNVSATTKPILAVTMGDPAGTGAELIAKAFATAEVRDVCQPVVIGDAAVMRDAARIVGSALPVRAIASPREAAGSGIEVVDLHNVEPSRFVRGKVSAHCGDAAHAYIKRAVELTRAGEAHAVVTSAINKAALYAAGHHYDGHTELLSELCGKPKVTMMLVADKLRVCHVSTHVALREAIERARPERIISVIRLADAGVRELGIENPHIAVAGINPHAGEGGIFGDEEIKYIAPAIEQAKALGFRVSGPYAGDTVFFRTLQGQFDCAIAMYHDQGHVAAKMLGIWLGVNVTLGLPIIRTSVEHGTDFDNAGTGRGDPRSLVQALKLAAVMAGNRLRATGSAIREPNQAR